MNHLPTNTLRDLALLIVFAADVAWDGAKESLKRIRPYLEPPVDIEVRSTIGGIYTGVILIEKNEIIAGFVVRVGHRSPPSTSESSSFQRPSSSFSSPSSSAWRSPLVTPRPGYRDDEDDNEGKLPSWSEDSRETEYDRWRR